MGGTACVRGYQVPEYFVGEWSECSTNCGAGTQSRVVECRSNTNAVLADSDCAVATPARTAACNPGACLPVGNVTALVSGGADVRGVVAGQCVSGIRVVSSVARWVLFLVVMATSRLSFTLVCCLIPGDTIFVIPWQCRRVGNAMRCAVRSGVACACASCGVLCHSFARGGNGAISSLPLCVLCAPGAARTACPWRRRPSRQVFRLRCTASASPPPLLRCGQCSAQLQRWGSWSRPRTLLLLARHLTRWVALQAVHDAVVIPANLVVPPASHRRHSDTATQCRVHTA